MTDIALICGIDEAGRGPWAGPVTAAAVILDPARPIAGLTDSKKLSEKKRLELEVEIKAKAASWAVAHISCTDIDRINIREATFLAMTEAARRLAFSPAHYLIDGNALPSGLPTPATAIVKGDMTEPAIAAASILAKSERDRIMVDLCAKYPGYGFSQHKGYGTEAHAGALERLGPCPEHRLSFAPVRAAMNRLSSQPNL